MKAMKDVIVTVQGFGTFIVNADKVQQLIAWLQANKAIGVNENTNQGGEQLLRG
jgi:hypothetical protein